MELDEAIWVGERVVGIVIAGPDSTLTVMLLWLIVLEVVVDVMADPPTVRM